MADPLKIFDLSGKSEEAAKARGDTLTVGGQNDATQRRERVPGRAESKRWWTLEPVLGQHLMSMLIPGAETCPLGTRTSN